MKKQLNNSTHRIGKVMRFTKIAAQFGIGAILIGQGLKGLAMAKKKKAMRESLQWEGRPQFSSMTKPVTPISGYASKNKIVVAKTINDDEQYLLGVMPGGPRIATRDEEESLKVNKAIIPFEDEDDEW